jgi:pimeloyl-ACP methyl ester carboxylesterase
VEHVPNWIRQGLFADQLVARLMGVSKLPMGTLVPDDMDHVDVGGHRIAYRERGEGPPLVLLHGWPLDSREWRRQLDGLSDEFRVVAWDAPGAGESSDPPETARLSDWAAWLAEFIETLDLDPAHVAGLSFGGGLALELFRQHPGIARSLVLVSAYAGWGGSLPQQEVWERLELTRRNTELPPSQWVPALIKTLLPEGSGAELSDELASMLADFHPAATRTSLQAFAEADLSDMLADVDVPTLLLYGELDVRAPREVREPIHDGITRSRLVVIPEVGHMVDMQAAERCNAEIREFLHQVEQSQRIEN